jgi:hypothetical protein
MSNNTKSGRAEVFAFSAPPALAERLKQIKASNPGKFSSIVSEMLAASLYGVDADILEEQIIAKDREIYECESHLSSLRREKAELESRLREYNRNQNKATEHRLSLLERAVRQKWLDDPERYRAWATGPAGIDTLADCNFRSPDEALAWIRANTHLMEM